MKAAIVLNSDSATFLRQAGEIGRLMGGLDSIQEAELWLFHHTQHPPDISGLPFGVGRIWLIPIKKASAAEAYLSQLEQMFQRHSVELLFLADDDLGCELATRLALRLGGSSCLQAESARISQAGLSVQRPAYGHNMTASFLLTKTPYCLCPAKSGGSPAKPVAAGEVRLERADLDQAATPWVVEAEISPMVEQTALDEAEVVLAVGLGVGNRDNLEKLGRVAQALGAEIGVSRPVAMNGWAAMDRLIGASGKVLAPSVCLIAGVSGSSVFSYGIRASDFIVAVNTDAQAPIFKMADVGLVGDMMDILPKLAELAVSSSSKKGGVK